MTLAKNNNLVGLDIGANSLKLLKIDSAATPKRIENFAIVALPPDAIVKGEIKDYEAVANTLRNAIQQSKTSSKNFALSIPRSSAVIKNINVDNRLSEDDIESRAWIEAKHHFPELVGDIYLDFSILGPAAQAASQLELILVACRKDLLKPYIEVLNLASLNATVVDVSNYALERALLLIAERMPETKTVALLNLDFNLSTLIVIQDKKLIYSHDETFDGNRLMKQVREIPKDSPNYLETMRDSLSAHLRHTMHFFYSSRPNIGIEKMILSGDCALLPDLATLIQQETGVEIMIADPFANMEIAGAVDKQALQKNAPALMLSCGLALSVAK